jgi:hypothetical protein
MYGKGRISAAGFDRWLRVSMMPLPQVADMAGKHGRQVGFPVISGEDRLSFPPSIGAYRRGLLCGKYRCRRWRPTPLG